MLKSIVNLLSRLLGLPTISALEAQLQAKTIQLQKIEEQHQALYRVISNIRASLDLETIFRTTAQETCKLLQVDHVAVYRFSEDWGGEFVGEFEFVETQWEATKPLGKHTVWNDTYLQEHQGGRYRHNEMFVVSNIYEADLSPCHIEILEQFQVQAFATAPIFLGQQLWGILAAYQHSAPYSWQPLEIRYLSQVATQLGFAVKQTQLLRQAEHQAKEFQRNSHQQQILANVTAEIRESLDMDTLFKTTTREVRKLLNADRVAIFQFTPNSDARRGEFIAENVIPTCDSALGVQVEDHCFADNYSNLYVQGRTLVISDAYRAGFKDCHLAILERFQVKAKIVVPLMEGRQLWGLLSIHQCDAPRHWEESEVQFVKQLAAQFNIALEHANLLAKSRFQEQKLANLLEELQQANMRLENLTRLDPLTQIANRRCFDEAIAHEWQRLKRSGSYLSLIIFDIDYFKLYNDNYGHPAGDRCLTQITQAAQTVLKRPADVLARYGGEEFIIILPDTSADGAIKVIEQLFGAIKGLAIPHEYVPPQHPPFVTISAGLVSQIPTAQTTYQSLIEAADFALYRAKDEGRNQWIQGKANLYSLAD